MCYFPCDIPYMSKKELEANGIKIPKDEIKADSIKMPETSGDLISRHLVLDFINRIKNLDPKAKGSIMLSIKAMPSVQLEKDAEFWRKRSEEYCNTCLEIMAEMLKGTRFDSIRIDENGITYGKERPERKVGKWTEDNACEFCGFKPWYERDIHMLSYCPNCGADMRGEQHE